MSEEGSSCEDKISEFSSWVYDKIVVHGVENNFTAEKLNIDKKAFAKAGVDVSKIDIEQFLGLTTDGAFAFLPEFVERYKKLMSEVCPHHNAVLSIGIAPLLESFLSVLQVFVDAGQMVKDGDFDDTDDGDKHFNDILRN